MDIISTYNHAVDQASPYGKLAADATVDTIVG